MPILIIQKFPLKAISTKLVITFGAIFGLFIIIIVRWITFFRFRLLILHPPVLLFSAIIVIIEQEMDLNMVFFQDQLLHVSHTNDPMPKAPLMITLKSLGLISVVCITKSKEIKYRFGV